MQPPDDMTNASSNLETIRGAYGAFAQGNVPAVLGIMHDDIVWHEAEGFPYGGTYHGPEAIANNIFMKIGTEWDGFQVQPEEFVDGGDTVVVLGQYSGTYKETGTSMQAPFAHVWKLRGGKVHTFTQHTDTVLVQRALAGA